MVFHSFWGNLLLLAFSNLFFCFFFFLCQLYIPSSCFSAFLFSPSIRVALLSSTLYATWPGTMELLFSRMGFRCFSYTVARMICITFWEAYQVPLYRLTLASFLASLRFRRSAFPSLLQLLPWMHAFWQKRPRQPCIPLDFCGSVSCLPLVACQLYPRYFFSPPSFFFIRIPDLCDPLSCSAYGSSRRCCALPYRSCASRGPPHRWLSCVAHVRFSFIRYSRSILCSVLF